MSKKFAATIDQIKAKVDKEIETGVVTEAKKDNRVVAYIKKADSKRHPGILDFFNNPKNGSPQTNALISSSKLPEMAANHFQKLVEKGADLDLLKETFWKIYGTDDSGLEGDAKIIDAVICAQSTAFAKMTGNKFAFEFTPVTVKATKVEKETFNAKTEGMENKIYYISQVLGWFTQYDDDGKVIDSKPGLLKGWDEEAMVSISELDPFTTYRGELEGRETEGVFQLSLNGACDWEETGSQTIENLAPMMIKGLQASKGAIMTVSDVQDVKFVGYDKANPKRTRKYVDVIIECMVSEHLKARLADGKNYGRCKIAPSGLAIDPVAYQVNFYDDAALATKYGESSIVLLGATVNKRKDQTLGVTGNWIIPITARGQTGAKTVGTVPHNF